MDISCNPVLSFLLRIVSIYTPTIRGGVLLVWYTVIVAAKYPCLFASWSCHLNKVITRTEIVCSIEVFKEETEKRATRRRHSGHPQIKGRNEAGAKTWALNKLTDPDAVFAKFDSLGIT